MPLPAPLGSVEVTIVTGATLTIETAGRGLQGVPGPPGASDLPDPATLANGRMLAVLDGAYVDIAPPAGTGDMQSLIYDPQGVAANCFNLANLSGNLDGGTFT